MSALATLARSMDWKLELIQVPVSDVDRAKEFYVEKAGFKSDVQHFPWGDFVFFSDPDGNGWAVQAIPPRG
jgi:catechol 2,3-dioxygenase-like lactoylglutathione lyase family enzyme